MVVQAQHTRSARVAREWPRGTIARRTGGTRAAHAATKTRQNWATLGNTEPHWATLDRTGQNWAKQGNTHVTFCVGRLIPCPVAAQQISPGVGVEVHDQQMGVERIVEIDAASMWHMTCVTGHASVEIDAANMWSCVCSERRHAAKVWRRMATYGDVWRCKREVRVSRIQARTSLALAART